MDSVNMSLSQLQEIVKDKEALSAAVHGVAKSQTWLSNWTIVDWLFQPVNRQGTSIRLVAHIISINRLNKNERLIKFSDYT